MKRMSILLLTSPWLLAACDDPEARLDADLAELAGDPDAEEPADAANPDAADRPELLAEEPGDPQKGLLCIVCILAGNNPTCGADGESYPNACFANCEGGGAVPAGLYWPDDDGDEHGDASATPTSACAQAEGTAPNGDDCDDNEDTIHPGEVQGCNGVDNDCDPDSVCIPSSCSEVRSEDPSAGDGEYTLHVDHDPTRPWTVYCHDMAATQADYLPLVALGAGRNFSQYTAGQFATGTNVRTSFTHVRIDPGTLAVEFDDVTFSSSTGLLYHSNTAPVTVMPYGVASGCEWNYVADGLANIDLTGTPFRMLDNFCTAGAQGAGGAVLSQNDQVADITGGGACGWTSPGCTFGPHERNNATVLQLQYIDP